MFRFQQLPAARADTPFPAFLLPTRTARDSCLPLRRLEPFRSPTTALAATETRQARLPGCVHSRRGNGPLPEIPEVGVVAEMKSAVLC